MNNEPILPKAVALRYDSKKDDAPRIVASGQGPSAIRIIELAQAAGIHVTQDQDLLELLAQLPLDSKIPAELYQAVAEVLAFMYQINSESDSDKVEDST